MARLEVDEIARIALVTLAVTGASCTKGSGSVGRAVATAATVAAVEVAAAAANRGITGCYTTCGYGTQCDESTGLCVPQGECVSNQLNSNGANCGKTPEYLQATSCTAPAAGAPAEPIDDSCAGFCLSTEKCVVYRGDLDCVPR